MQLRSCGAGRRAKQVTLEDGSGLDLPLRSLPRMLEKTPVGIYGGGATAGAMLLRSQGASRIPASSANHHQKHSGYKAAGQTLRKKKSRSWCHSRTYADTKPRSTRGILISRFMY